MNSFTKLNRSMAEHDSIAETFCFSSGSAPVIAQNYI